MKETLTTIIKSLVTDESAISINEVEGEQSVIYEVKVAEKDMGKVIGKEGRIAKAIRTNSLNSTVSRWGIFTKFLMFIPLILSNLLDNLLALNGTALTICTIFYICSEGLSICENLASAGVPLPKQLIDLLEKVSNENNDKTLPR